MDNLQEQLNIIKRIMNLKKSNEINPRLKKIIFKKLDNDLKNLEIIPYGNSIWFIDVENKKWFFEYEINGTLQWSVESLIDYFNIFSLEQKEYESVMSDWVSKVLNRKVKTIYANDAKNIIKIEDILKSVKKT